MRHVGQLDTVHAQDSMAPLPKVKNRQLLGRAARGNGAARGGVAHSEASASTPRSRDCTAWVMAADIFTPSLGSQ